MFCNWYDATGGGFASANRLGPALSKWQPRKSDCRNGIWRASVARRAKPINTCYHNTYLHARGGTTFALASVEPCARRPGHAGPREEQFNMAKIIGIDL